MCKCKIEDYSNRPVSSIHMSRDSNGSRASESRDNPALIEKIKCNNFNKNEIKIRNINV